MELDDIVFVTLPESIDIASDSFTFNPDVEIPVQLADGTKSISQEQGITIEMIAAGLIKVIAYKNDHPHFEYYRSLLTALQPDIVYELQIAGIAKAQGGETEFAQELFLTACHLNPHIPELYVNLAVLYAQQAKAALDDDNQKEYDKHIASQLEILEQGLQHIPLSDVLLSELGLLHLFLGNEEQAFEILTSYLRIAPDGEKKETIRAQVEQLGTQLESEKTLLEAFDQMQLGNEEQALRLSESYIEVNPSKWSGHFIKGWAHRRLGQYQEAQSSFLHCLELGEQHPDIYNELSICANELGEQEMSKSYLEIAIDIDDSDVKLLSNLAFLHLRDESYNEVQRLVERAEQIDPQDPAIIYLKEELDKRFGTKEDEDVIDG
ncbi:MAG: hypothetical protein WC990_02235 [Sphaerochaetaceae bacterium]